MDFEAVLSGGDRRSIGRADEVANHVLAHKSALPSLAAVLTHGDPVIRMRAADALEKISAEKADWLNPFADELLDVAQGSRQQELRWHTAQILPRLTLNNLQRKRAISLLFQFMEDESRIVNVSALTALVELSVDDANLRLCVKKLVNEAAKTGAPSMKARAKALAKRL